jgi:hypothetical protein
MDARLRTGAPGVEQYNRRAAARRGGGRQRRRTTRRDTVLRTEDQGQERGLPDDDEKVGGAGSGASTDEVTHVRGCA